MNRKFAKRLFTGFVALCVAVMTPLSVSAETVGEIEAAPSSLEA